MLAQINIFCKTNIRSEKIKDEDLGLPLAIFAQAFSRKSEEQKILFEGSSNLCLTVLPY
jgi:hypothetical protein